MGAPRVLVSCIPLVNFGGLAPKGLQVRRCVLPDCGREVVITKESLSIGNITIACEPCATAIIMFQTQRGDNFTLARAPGSLRPDSDVERAFRTGEMHRDRNSSFRELPELTSEELSRINAKDN